MTLGANANFGKGDFGSYANLADFKGQRHLYAVGPVQHLGGEVLVIDSVPYAAEVRNGKLTVTSSWDYQPPFFVYSKVLRWQEIAIPSGVTTYTELESWIGEAAALAGIAEGRPFAFLVRALPVSLTVTVMNRPASAVPGDKPTKAYQTTWEIGGQDTEFVGFYSTRHTGVFLGSGEKIHTHALTHDHAKSGHVQDFSLSAGSFLYLPR